MTFETDSQTPTVHPKKRIPVRGSDLQLLSGAGFDISARTSWRYIDRYVKLTRELVQALGTSYPA
jgi:hypothetical protein